MSVSDARWQRVNELFHAALARTPAERDGFLARECGADSQLRIDVQSLLAAHDAGGSVAQSLTAGTRLGDYEVTSFIAAGAMGQVYRARDTRLGRDVALKILPPAFISDPDRRTRFEREARTLASLTHPNIATIYGVEEAAGVSALALELVEGETLADRIARGRLPIDEALRIARQIADALEAAHERGIVHRDLKPANIKITRDGFVKVLDFGLAKLAQGASPDVLTIRSAVPTEVAATAVGMLVGTPAYMSPEQARGEIVDKRTDIWAFGCILFEMLTGAPPFRAPTISGVLARVMESDPDLDYFPAQTPDRLREFVRRCLEKSPRRRLRDIGDALHELATVDASGAGVSGVASARSQRWSTVAVGAGVLAIATAAMFVWMTPTRAPQPVIRFALTSTGPTAVGADANDRAIAISPDGLKIAYEGAGATVGGSAIDDLLLVRNLGQLEPASLAGPASIREPFFSPDGEWIAFFDPLEQLNKVAATGGPVIRVGNFIGGSRGATWRSDGTIVLATNDRGATGLLQIAADGGEPKVLTRPDATKGERDHFWPHFLPDGNAVLFTIVPNGGIEGAKIAVLDLRNGRQRTVLTGGSDGRYVDGYLVYGTMGTIRAVPFDVNRLDVRGTPIPVLDAVMTTPTDGAANFAISSTGTLAYVMGNRRLPPLNRTLVAVDRAGRATTIFDKAGAYRAPRVSPDGKRIAIDVAPSASVVSGSVAENRDIWVLDIDRGTQMRLTTGGGFDGLPLWTPDGTRVAYSSSPIGSTNTLFWIKADGSGRPEPLVADGIGNEGATSWSPDGHVLVYYENFRAGSDLFTVKPGEPPVKLTQTPFREQGAAFSPDGRWIAYTSNESGSDEIYLMPYPGPGGRIAVSSGGGRSPRWSQDGGELFYRNGRQMMVVTISRQTPLAITAPRQLFEGDYVQEDPGQGAHNYDLFPDGRFLLMKDVQDPNFADAAPPQIVVVQNWINELKRMVPTK